MQLNNDSINAVDNALYSDGLLMPLYDSYSFSNIPGTIESLLSGSTELNTLPKSCFNKTETNVIILIFIDALGWLFLKEFLFDNDDFKTFTRNSIVSKLTSIFPSTTTAHVPLMHTGKLPPQSKLLEWRQYNSTLQDIIIPIKNTFAYKDLTIEKKYLNKIYPNNKFYERLSSKGIDSTVLLGEEYGDSQFNNLMTKGSSLVTYRAIEEAFEYIVTKTSLKKAKAKLYFHFYMNTIDTLLHKYGTRSELVKNEIIKTFKLINKYLLNLTSNDKVSLILTADHGHDDYDPDQTIFINKRIPQINSMIKTNAHKHKILPAGSSKCFFLFIKKDQISSAYNLLNNHLSTKCNILLSSEVLRDKLFGNVDYDERFTEMVGQIIILPKDGFSVSWDTEPLKQAVSVSQHGGLTRRQSEIPFIFI